MGGEPLYGDGGLVENNNGDGDLLVLVNSMRGDMVDFEGVEVDCYASCEMDTPWLTVQLDRCVPRESAY
jgi:hypothetical protein